MFVNLGAVKKLKHSVIIKKENTCLHSNLTSLNLCKIVSMLIYLNHEKKYYGAVYFIKKSAENLWSSFLFVLYLR